MPCIGTSAGYPISGGPITAGEPDSRLPIRPIPGVLESLECSRGASHPSRHPLPGSPDSLPARLMDTGTSPGAVPPLGRPYHNSMKINYHPHSGWFDEGPSKGPPPCGRGLEPPEV